MIGVNGSFLATNMTGVQRYAYQLLVGLLAATPHLEIRVYVPASTTINSSLVRELIQGGARVVPAPRWARNKQVFEQVALPLMVARDRVHRLLHLSNSLSVLTRVRQVCLVYDLAPVRLPHTYRIAYRAKFRAVLAGARILQSQVVTLSEFSRRELESVGLTVSGVVPAAAGSPMLLALHPGNGQLDEGTELETLPTPFALIFGSADPRKRVSEVVAHWSGVYRQLGLNLVVVQGASALHQKTRSSQPSPGVIQLKGRVSDQDLVRLARRSAVAIFASSYEGGALAPQELLALGTPIVVADIPAFRELLPATVPFFSGLEGLGECCAEAMASPRPQTMERGEAAAAWNAAALYFIDAVGAGPVGTADGEARLDALAESFGQAT